MGKVRIITRADVEEFYPGLMGDDEFVPTHYIEVRDDKCLLRRDLVRLDESTLTNGVAYAYGPGSDRPLYGVLSTGLWQSLVIHGRIRIEAICYDATYVSMKNRNGVVYFIQAGTEGPIKVGWSQDVNRRISELQTANAHRLVLLGTFPGTLETEATTHARFSHLRLEAEWFENSQEIHDFLHKMTVDPL